MARQGRKGAKLPLSLHRPPFDSLVVLLQSGPQCRRVGLHPSGLRHGLNHTGEQDTIGQGALRTSRACTPSGCPQRSDARLPTWLKALSSPLPIKGCHDPTALIVCAHLDDLFSVPVVHQDSSAAFRPGRLNLGTPFPGEDLQQPLAVQSPAGSIPALLNRIGTSTPRMTATEIARNIAAPTAVPPWAARNRAMPPCPQLRRMPGR